MSIVILGDPGGSSFAGDDFTFDFNPAGAAPEPSTLLMILVGLAGLAALRRARRPERE